MKKLMIVLLALSLALTLTACGERLGRMVGELVFGGPAAGGASSAAPSSAASGAGGGILSGFGSSSSDGGGLAPLPAGWKPSTKNLWRTAPTPWSMRWTGWMAR